MERRFTATYIMPATRASASQPIAAPFYYILTASCCAHIDRRTAAPPMGAERDILLGFTEHRLGIPIDVADSNHDNHGYHDPECRRQTATLFPREQAE